MELRHPRPAAGGLPPRQPAATRPRLTAILQVLSHLLTTLFCHTNCRNQRHLIIT